MDARLKIPKTFVIKGKTWKIKKLKRVVHADGEECRGLADFDTHTITIEKGMEPLQEVQILIHELIHAALHEAHLGPNSGLPDSVEEIVCDAIADMITGCFTLGAKRVKKPKKD